MDKTSNRCLGVERLKTIPLKTLGVIIIGLIIVMGLSACISSIKDTDGDCYIDKVEKKEGTDPLDPNSTPPDEDGDCITDAQEALMDSDGDAINNKKDNCKTVANPKQNDRDGDHVGDVCDNCPDAKNTGQVDKDADMIGNACDNAPKNWNPGQEDTDSDGIPDVLDNCPQRANGPISGTCTTGINQGNPCKIAGSNIVECGTKGYCSMNQEDADSDNMGDACDGEDYSFKPKTDPNKPPPDDDKDGIANSADNCPNDANADQEDTDKDGQGDVCDPDDDNDGILDASDSCPLEGNIGDSDTDGIDDVCDLDDDNDNILDTCDADNNPTYSDADGDNVIDNCDNCKNDPNPDQLDSDNNGVGDVCEPDFMIKFMLSDPLKPGQDIYDAWLPKDGRQAQITAKLFDKSGNLLNAVITLTLVDSLTSLLPGKYTNDGSIDASYDYSVTSGDGTSVITIKSHDYGGKTVISGETIYNGKPIFSELRVPKDSDNDGLPDAFESDTNLNPSGKLDPFKQDSDSDNVLDGLEDKEGAAGQDVGDGLIAVEEYRGVMWNGEHRRLSSEKKNLFIAAVDFADQGFPFAVGDAFKNAEVNVLSIQTVSYDQQWDQISTNNFEDENIDVLIVRSYASGWSGGDYNTGHIRRIGVRKWDIPVLGESYFGNDDHYGAPTKVYARSIKNYFNDRPYWDGGAHIDTNGDGQPDTYVVPPDAHLNPISDPTLEDQDDNGVLGKKEDTYIKNGRLDGDRIDTDVSTWANQGKLNPYNIDNDADVELPQNIGDPYTVPTGDEYDMATVFRHVITHELGHAVGMGKGDPALVDNWGHCFDQSCVMYQYSTNWKRDGYFCTYHQMLIRIHNN